MPKTNHPILATYCTAIPYEKVYDHTTQRLLPVSLIGPEMPPDEINCPRTEEFESTEEIGCFACSCAANGYDPIVEGV